MTERLQRRAARHRRERREFRVGYVTRLMESERTGSELRARCQAFLHFEGDYHLDRIMRWLETPPEIIALLERDHTVEQAWELLAA